jgi:hypothetical protein
MPAINVARTDTFEQQRVKINEIGSQLFNVTSGGSDLSTGNLKLGDGTQPLPSLSFVSDDSLGLYKPTSQTIGYVSSGKKLVDISSSAVYSYKDVLIRQEVISAVSTISFGQNYDAGSYTGISFTGGSGSGAIADFEVVAFNGTIVEGTGYKQGVYTGITTRNISGTGTGTLLDFQVEGIVGIIGNSGQNYKPGNYTAVPLTNGSGSGAEANINITGTETISSSITSPGSGYSQGVYQFANIFNVPTQTFIVTANGTTNFIIDGNPQPTLNLVQGNTYRFDVSDSSNTGHQLRFSLTNGGFIGAEFFTIEEGTYGTAGSFVDFVISANAPTGTYAYDCTFHPGMGGAFTVSTGAIGNYGKFGAADFEVDSNGNVISFDFSVNGTDYKVGDTVSVNGNSYGGGSGFVAEITGISYDGIVDSITITDSGSGYLAGETLGINDADVGGVGGSGFAFSITNNPGIPFDVEISTYGTGYQTGDVFGLPLSITGVNTNLKSVVLNVSTTLSTLSNQITVASTTGIIAGMEVFNGGSDVGVLGPSTSVQSIDGPTQLTLSVTPIGDGTADLEFRSTGVINQITVSSTANIVPGSTITQTAGTGILGTGVLVSSIVDSTTIELSVQPQQAGTATLSFEPSFGDGSSPLTFTVGDLGVIDSFTISNGGIGYTVGDELSVNPTDLTQAITYQVSVKTLQQLSFAASTYASGTFSVGDTVKPRYGTVISVIAGVGTTVPAAINGTYNNVVATGGNGTGATFDVVRDSNGDIAVVTVSSGGGGYYYEISDILTIPGGSIGGSTPADNLTITVDTATVSADLEVYKVSESGGFTDSILVDTGGVLDGDIIVPSSGPITEYTIDTASLDTSRYFIDTGSGPTLTPNLTLYAGNIYEFDISDPSNSGYNFSFSEYRDGSNSPSLIENVATVLSTSTTQITVTSTTGILPGMIATTNVSSGGQIIPGTTVVSVDSPTTLTLSNIPLSSGLITLDFAGFSYADSVTNTATSVIFKPGDFTPSTLYYYDGTIGSADLGGSDNEEGVITVDQNNPKVFGSGFLVNVSILQTTDVISGNIETGLLNAVSFTGQSATFTNAEVTTKLDVSSIEGDILSIASITSSSNANTINLSATDLQLNSNVGIGTTLTINQSSGDLTTSGVVSTTGSFNASGALTITANSIESGNGLDIELLPAANRVVKVIGTSALNIPAGDTSSRPGPGVVDNGSIRYNTQTNQYEGYSSSTSSWSSLGGVRDLDGNTTILAEESVGANDNTLWFYNDNINTIRVTPSHLDFVNVKKVKSTNISAPSFVQWTANTPVISGQYLKYRNNLYEVTIDGTTGTSGTEPTHTSGAVLNGTAELTWYSLAVSPLTFEDISELRVGPLGNLPLIVNSDLRLAANVLSTDINDLIVRPNAGKKVIVDAETSLVVPVGPDANRGIAVRGSIRFSETTSQFEGYDGTNWGSLGGVKDVDQNTYIIPETSPGANENTLFFYNDNNNTLRLTTTALDFDAIDTIRSVTSNEFEITAALLTFDNGTSTFDNTDQNITFLHTTKQYFDLGLSAGLTTDPVLRLDDQGDVYLNIGFGTGVFDGVKVFDGDLKEFELADIKIQTEKLSLVKGTSNNGSSDIYLNTTNSGAKTTVFAENTTTGDKEFIEFGILDDGTDVFHTEYGNIRTGQQLIVPTFEVTGANVVRINIQLGANVNSTETVNITVVSNVTKK